VIIVEAATEAVTEVVSHWDSKGDGKGVCSPMVLDESPSVTAHRYQTTNQPSVIVPMVHAKSVGMVGETEVGIADERAAGMESAMSGGKVAGKAVEMVEGMKGDSLIHQDIRREIGVVRWLGVRFRVGAAIGGAVRDADIDAR